MAKIGNHEDSSKLIYKGKRIALLAGIAGCLIGMTAQAQELQINSYANRTTVSLNQQFELSVELSGEDANKAPKPSVPDLDAFASYVGSGSSTNMSLVNGRMSVSVTYTHHYIATKEGKFTIPAISLSYKGKTFSSQPIEIEVVKAQSAPSQPGRQASPNTNRSNGSDQADLSEVLFLRAEANKHQVYQNEPVVVSYKIYTAVQVTNYGIAQLPNTVGFWTEDFDIPSRPRLYTEVINGRQYQVAEIKRVALFPQGPGEKKLDPLIIECEVQLPRQRSRRRDLFDSFFDDPFFGLGRTVRQRVVSNALNIDVKPLPQSGRPANFSGAVGDFTIEATVDKNEAKTNEAITLSITVAGTGNMEIIPQPDVSFPQDFEVYDPKISENIEREGERISGSKTFEYVLIPRFPGKQNIKPVTFSFFDLSARRYKTVSTRSIELKVDRGEGTFAAGGPIVTTKEDVKFIGQDIRYIQMRLPEFTRMDDVFYKGLLFYLALGVPLFVLAGAVAYRRHQDKLSSNVAYARSRKANQMALRRLKQANAELSKGNQKQFYAEVAKALMGFVGDKLNVSAAGLITEQVDAMLRERGIDETIVKEYLSCLETSDFQRFAPSEADENEMKVFFNRAKTAIISLEKVI